MVKGEKTQAWNLDLEVSSPAKGLCQDLKISGDLNTLDMIHICQQRSFLKR
jgi:hypothetical protein